MTFAALALPSRRVPSPRWIVGELLVRQRSLAVLGFAFFLAAVAAAALSLVDQRMFDGVDVWIKPLKFMVSLGVFALTTAWIVGYVRPDHRRRWPVRTIAAITIAASLFELGYITVQAARGEASHFNVGDPFHAAMYSLMGVMAVSLTGTAAALAVVVARHADEGLAPAFKLSLVLGLALTFVLGTASGAYMGAQAGHFAAGIKSAPGLPILGWSRVGGDWRVAHFFGMHAQQIVPACGALIAGLAPRRGISWVIAFTAAYTVLTLATFLQAAINVPFLRF